MTQQPHSHPPNQQAEGAASAYIALILDETGSMQDCKGAAIAGFNEYVKKLREVPASVSFTLTLFNSNKLEVRHRNEPISRIPELTKETYRPEATTPLFDAIGTTLTTAGHEAPAAARKLFVVLTDGLENASREYTGDGIRRMIRDYEDKGWIFVYLGADHDAWSAGKDLGIAGDNTVQFCSRNTGHMFDRLSEATATFLSGEDTHKRGFWMDDSKEARRNDTSETPKGGAA